ncbi:MAG: alpha-hydroxy acid oxidase [Proteobacteria bacterium]|nr:alpha-hydroxy-acid oxidizing protein [Gammaproteobacteria bacterium]MDA0826977.1 alpha-hydroxy acid oxidase [Pseudomonadota bacterium]MDB4567273.1 alpha-hydroxy-acid oxidizing protein [Pseudomonadales bacterium]MDC1313824.1 alpha-hydroxy-acid oxidizing protein [Pseudomonadales bacterium]
MTTITCIEDLKALYKRRVPKMFYDYTESGSWTEQTFKSNETALQRILFKQRVLVDLSQRSVASTLLGQPVSMPVALAPVGLTGYQHADGEIKAAIAAARFGVPYTLSTMSICSIEDVAAKTSAPFWFQLYVMRDRGFIRRLIQRAKAAECSALVLTVDLQILGQRHKDIKNGLSTPPKPTLKNIINMVSKPRWGLGMLGTPRRDFGNIIGHVAGVEDTGSLSEWTRQQFDPGLNWDDVAWIKDLWGGPLIIKGIMTPEDACLARDHGADAIIVSNHGGRQLDGAPASIEVLPAIKAAVGDRLEVLMDGGIRSGQDVLRALASGADGTMVGRAYIYGLGALGEAGVVETLNILRNELDLTMAFCGRTNIASVSDDILWS